MFRHPDAEVLVVGAGPVGLVAGLFLRQYGVRVEIVDMHQWTTQHSYALPSIRARSGFLTRQDSPKDGSAPGGS